LSVRTWITAEPISAQEVLRAVGSDEDGAVLLFLGTVRRENEGRAVSGMRYDAYREMADAVLNEIAAEAAARMGSTRIAIAHRIGELSVGEISVAIAISTPHRAQTYDGSRFVIEEIKKRLPVWKREHYTSGESGWLGGDVPSVVEATSE
jgi:molybdopterin synthase catalytic subunit